PSPVGAAALSTPYTDEPGTYVDQRLEELLSEAYFTGEFIISPAEVLDAWTTGNLTFTKYSYALSYIGNEDPGETPQAVQALEWRDTTNSEAIMISDQARGRLNAVVSIWTTNPGDWR